MSGLGFTDNIVNDYDELSQLKRDLEEMDDMPTNLNYDNSGLMSSEFFDSVFSMEQCNLDNGLLSNDTDYGLSNDADEMRTISSCSPDSLRSSTGYELNDCGLSNNNMDIENNINSNLSFVNKQLEPKVINMIQPKQIKPKLLINNINGKNVIVTKPFIFKNSRKATNDINQVVRIQSIGKARSVMLPYDVGKLKKIVLNGNELKAEDIKITKINNLSQLQQTFFDTYEASSPDTFDDDSDSTDAKHDHGRQYPVLILTDEEKRLLNKEGIQLPNRYPLTKHEERELKRIRRKIRNKISAQDSRKRKKEYVDGLEERIRQGAEEKKVLMNRVKQLQQQNNRLMSQMNKLQALVCNTNNSKATPTTCLLIVLVSVLLVSLPNLRLSQNSESKSEQQVNARRALLSSQQATNEDTANLDEFLLFNKEEEGEIVGMFDEDNNTEEYDKKYNKKFEEITRNFLKGKNNPFLDVGELDKDIRSTYDKMKDFLKKELQDSKHNKKIFDVNPVIKKKFMEPDIDDDGPNIYMDRPPAKRAKVFDTRNENLKNVHVDEGNNVISTTVVVNSSRKE